LKDQIVCGGRENQAFSGLTSVVSPVAATLPKSGESATKILIVRSKNEA
jgi:hypothetical protein